jgi:CubicO group peptidase (beta-lactamase class C family)
VGSFADPNSRCQLTRHATPPWTLASPIDRGQHVVAQDGLWHEARQAARVVSETWIDAATAPQIKTTQGGFYYGYQFWLSASSVSGRQIDWIAARGQGGQRLLIVPTFDLVAVVTAGNYYGNDRFRSQRDPPTIRLSCQSYR